VNLNINPNLRSPLIAAWRAGFSLGLLSLSLRHRFFRAAEFVNLELENHPFIGCKLAALVDAMRNQGWRSE
jgi:hypothetical protein